jgi:BirA family transcriptional regulator, biotin operon repressor / biotin---[acetyl-CoA-carboxylase] ligase
MERDLVWRVERVGEVDSTNRVASERVLALWEAGESAAGIVILAERQSAGRGQHGRRWESPAGGMYLSAVVQRIPAEARAVLALVVGVAVAEAIGARIRWPNDLVIDDKKVGGILCESLAQGARWAAVIGIGINVNTEVAALPAEIRLLATSLAARDGHIRNVRAVETTVLERLAETLAALQTQGLPPLIEHAQALDSLRGKRIEIQDGLVTRRGRAAGIGKSGELLIQLDNGAVQGFPRGSIMSVDGLALRK